MWESVLRQRGFKMYEKEMTWKEAQSFCRKHHTDLATIRNKEKNSASSSFEGWIGLYKENKDDDWKWYRGDKIATFFNWYNGEPDYNDQNCDSKFLSEGQWRDWECDKRFKVICHDEILVLVKENKTWEEALEYCRALDGSSFQLATLLTVDDHNSAQELAQTATTDEVGCFSEMLFCG
uniref:C-type lectin domain-containing protein n=1 Tax=Cyprinodon variegatus TaxID=28743 RepID=A0A3Q2FE51_CYPVA